MRPARVTNGHERAAVLWRRLFALIPDLRGEVISWGHRVGVVYIELRLHGTLARRPVEWVTLDRIRLEAGKVRHRTACFDPLPLIGALARRPAALLQFLRTRLVN